MNTTLVSLLDRFMGHRMTPQLALAICNAALELPTLVRDCDIAVIEPETCMDCAFSLEKVRDIVEELKPLHQAHWQETESHRHGIPFNMDYFRLARYEQAGHFVLFTLRINNRLMGNCGMYLDRSMHTQTLMATEDTFYLLPEARGARRAKWFIRYCEDALRAIGVKEVNVSVKTVNKADRFFRMNGYSHVENGLSKILEAHYVQ